MVQWLRSPLVIDEHVEVRGTHQHAGDRGSIPRRGAPPKSRIIFFGLSTLFRLHTNLHTLHITLSNFLHVAILAGVLLSLSERMPIFSKQIIASLALVSDLA